MYWFSVYFDLVTHRCRCDLSFLQWWNSPFVQGHSANSSYSVVALPSGLLTSSSSFIYPLSPSPQSSTSSHPLTTATTLTVSCTASVGSIFTRTTTQSCQYQSNSNSKKNLGRPLVHCQKYPLPLPLLDPTPRLSFQRDLVKVPEISDSHCNRIGD